MILTCPECATHYKAKSTAIGVNGRTVRCRKCTATWFVAAPEDNLSTPDEMQLADMKAENSDFEVMLSDPTPPNSVSVETESPQIATNSIQSDLSESETTKTDNELPTEAEQSTGSPYSDQRHQDERRQGERRRVERRQSSATRLFGDAKSGDRSGDERGHADRSQTDRGFDHSESHEVSEPSEAAIAEAALQAKTADVIMRDKADEAKHRARIRIIRVIWGIPLGVIALILVGLFLARQSVVQTFPGTTAIYKAVGLKVSPTGLIVEPPIIKTAKVNGVQTIIINGAVKNISKKTKTLPPLVLSLHNAQGDPVAEWWVEFSVQTLEGQARIEFASDYPNPPLDGKELRYRLGFETRG